jgi:hypothetical protein
MNDKHNTRGNLVMHNLPKYIVPQIKSFYPNRPQSGIRNFSVGGKLIK